MEKYSRRQFLEMCVGAVISTSMSSRLIENYNSNSIEQIKPGESCEGIAGFYTESKEGCLDCNSKRITKSGERYNENDFTLAFMRAPIGSIVDIENRLNGKKRRARVNDHGGFENLGRIADLSKATKESIEGLDLTPVRITLIKYGRK